MDPIPRQPIPDALLVPASFKRGDTMRQRVCFVMKLVEPMLGVDRSKGERAYSHSQPNWLFITKDPFDTLLGNTRSPLRGRERYAWITGSDGIRRGWLLPEFLLEKEQADQKKRAEDRQVQCFGDLSIG